MTIQNVLSKGFDKIFAMSKEAVTIQVTTVTRDENYEETTSTVDHSAYAVIASDIEDALVELGAGYLDTGQVVAYFQPDQDYLAKNNRLVVDSVTYEMDRVLLRKTKDTGIYFKVNLKRLN